MLRQRVSKRLAPSTHRSSARNSVRESEREAKDAMRRELLALYAETDRVLAPFSCEASTDCCRFGVTGREPYPTAIELSELMLAMRRASVDVPSRHRALPLASEERRCPLLSAEGRCRAYASRPFGCRTFFCDRVRGPSKLPRATLQRISRDIAALSARFAPRDPHPRPLTNALGVSS